MLAADSVAEPEGAAGVERDAADLVGAGAEAGEEERMLLAALTRVLALALALALSSLAVAAAVGVAIATHTHTSAHHRPQTHTHTRAHLSQKIRKKKKKSLTLPPIPHDRKRRLAQTSRPAPQIALAALRPRRGHKHRGVAVPLVAPQTSRLREEGARAALGPEDAVRARAALRQGGGGGEGEGEVAGAEVGDYDYVSVSALGIPREYYSDCSRLGFGWIGGATDWIGFGEGLEGRAYKTMRHLC